MSFDYQLVFKLTRDIVLDPVICSRVVESFGLKVQSSPVSLVKVGGDFWEETPESDSAYSLLDFFADANQGLSIAVGLSSSSSQFRIGFFCEDDDRYFLLSISNKVIGDFRFELRELQSSFHELICSLMRSLDASRMVMGIDAIADSLILALNSSFDESLRIPGIDAILVRSSAGSDFPSFVDKRDVSCGTLLYVSITYWDYLLGADADI